MAGVKDPPLEPYAEETQGGYRILRYRFPDVWQRRYGVEPEAEVRFGTPPQVSFHYRVADDPMPWFASFGLIGATAPRSAQFRERAERDPGGYLAWIVRGDHRKRRKAQS